MAVVRRPPLEDEDAEDEDAEAKGDDDVDGAVVEAATGMGPVSRPPGRIMQPLASTCGTGSTGRRVRV
jgi:hypothetical protein